jgi:hypothetical protein
MAVELEAEIAIYERKFPPTDPVEARLVHRSALSSLRWTRLAQAELAESYARERHARRRWALARRRRVRRLLAQLHDPQHPDPSGARDALRQTSLGCRYLAREHARLAEVLDHRGALTPREIGQVARLAGHAAARLRFEAPPPEVRLWLCLLALAPVEAAAAYLAPPLRAAELPLPAADVARARLTGWLRRRAARLRRRAVALGRVETADRAQAPLRAAADASAEGARLARYLNDAERQHRRALADLAALRRAAADSTSGVGRATEPPPDRGSSRGDGEVVGSAMAPCQERARATPRGCPGTGPRDGPEGVEDGRGGRSGRPGAAIGASEAETRPLLSAPAPAPRRREPSGRGEWPLPPPPRPPGPRPSPPACGPWRRASGSGRR